MQVFRSQFATVAAEGPLPAVGYLQVPADLSASRRTEFAKKLGRSVHWAQRFHAPKGRVLGDTSDSVMRSVR